MYKQGLLVTVYLEPLSWDRMSLWPSSRVLIVRMIDFSASLSSYLSSLIYRHTWIRLIRLLWENCSEILVYFKSTFQTFAASICHFSSNSDSICVNRHLLHYNIVLVKTLSGTWKFHDQQWDFTLIIFLNPFDKWIMSLLFLSVYPRSCECPNSDLQTGRM